MTIIESIRVWGAKRPLWQQAAVQMLYEEPNLSPASYSQVFKLCQKENGLATEVAPAPALQLDECSGSRTKSVILLSISAVENVNALMPGQELTFDEKGVTLIFGDNGVGKSGYVRILKQACRARGGPSPIRSNAYADDATPSRATIGFRVDSGQPTTYEWSPASTPPIDLRLVSILDSRSAIVYADHEQDVAYLPFGLDLFRRLAQLCDRISTDLEGEIAKERSLGDRFLDFTPGTAVRTALDGVHAGSAGAILAKLRDVSPDELAALEALRAEEATLRVGDPAARAQELDLKARRIGAVRDVLSRMLQSVSNEVEQRLVQARAALSAAREAADAANDAAFGHFPIQGLTHDAWQTLWSAAEKFATGAAEPPQRFPPAVGEVCVLCQQPIGIEAEARLRAFHDFLGAELSAKVQAAAKALATIEHELDPIIAEAPMASDAADELNSCRPGLGAEIALLLEALRSRARELRAEAADVSRMPEKGIALRDECGSVITAVQEEAEQLRTTLQADRLAVLRAEIAELEARVQLVDSWPRVEAALARSQRIRKLEACLRSARTTSITNKGKELLEEMVTTPLARQFKKNVEALQLEHIPIEFAPTKGKKGTAIHRVRLDANGEVANSEVLSEGELRAIAIAAFLAEVQIQEGASTLVFDDPVSSLDLGRREVVARELVGLAKRRPVAVFTHDLPFAWHVVATAEAERVGLTERQLRRSANGAGVVANAMSLSGQPARRRVGPLKQRAVDLRKVFAVDPERYEREARLLYNDLRDTWERAVEDSLLNGALRRFGRDVKTQSLKYLHRITAEQMAQLERGMTKCSAVMHDAPEDMRRPVPEPDELASDVGECEEWITDLKKVHDK